MERQALTLTDLEEQLAQADGAAVRDRLLLQAAGLETRLLERLDAGLPRDEYSLYRAAADAAHAAQEILRDYPLNPTPPLSHTPRRTP